MAAVHDFENVVTAVSDVSCNIVELRYAVFFIWGGDRYRGRKIDVIGLVIFGRCFDPMGAKNYEFPNES